MLNRPLMFGIQTYQWCIRFLIRWEGCGVPRGALAFRIACNTIRNGKTVHSKRFEVITKLKMYHELTGIVQQRNGRIWIKGLSLLAYFDEALNDFVLVRNNGNELRGMSYEGISDVFEDRDKNVWAATNNNGLYRFNPDGQRFLNIVHPQRGNEAQTGSGAVMSFIQLKNGNILCGAWEDALFYYSPGLTPLPMPSNFPQPLRNSYIWSMCASADSNTVWMSAQPGFWEYNQAKQSLKFYNPPALQNHTVRQIAEDKYGKLWLGLHHYGVFCCTRSALLGKDSLVQLKEVGTSMINKLMTDNQGLLWIGTANNGLFVYDAGTMKLLQHYYVGINGNASITGLCHLRHTEL